VILMEGGRVREAGWATEVMRAEVLSSVYGIPLACHAGPNGAEVWLPAEEGPGVKSILSHCNPNPRSSHDLDCSC
jgi:ABC-type cobalamin/Fe3+-siderophores transport system ATPase subunit